MMKKRFNLDDISFVGGSRKEFQIKITTQNLEPFDASDCTVYFSLIPYHAQTSSAILRKEATVTTAGSYYVATFTLDTEDTIDFAGTYIYQITVNQGDTDSDPDHQGVCVIYRNTDPLSETEVSE